MSKKNRRNRHQQNQGGSQHPHQTPAPQGAATSAKAGANPPPTTPPPTPPPAAATSATNPQKKVVPIANTEAAKMLEEIKNIKAPKLNKPNDSAPAKPQEVTGSTDCKVIEKPDFKVVFNNSPMSGQALFSIALVPTVVFGICYVILMGLGKRFEFLQEQESSWLYSIWFLVTYIVFNTYHRHFWVRTDAQKALLFNNNFPGSTEIVVYSQGFSLKPFWFTPYSGRDSIDFQKTNTIKQKLENIMTRDGIGSIVEYQTLTRSLRDYLAEGLLFKDDVVEDRVKAVISDRIYQMFSMNTYEALAYNKDELREWVSLIFKGEGEVTPFEQHHGISVSKPQITDFKPTDAGQKLVDMLLDTLRFATISQEVSDANPGMEATDVMRTALRLMGKEGGLTDNQLTIRAPSGVHTVLLDNDGHLGRL